MKEKVKAVLWSRQFRLVFSGVLLFLAFRKIDVAELWRGLGQVPVWFVGAMIVYSSVGVLAAGIRWSFLVLEKPKWQDFWIFTKAAYLGMFYSLFLSSSAGGDLLKWVPLQRKYPDLSRLTLAGGVVLDRMVGFSAFVVFAFGALILGKLVNFEFPSILFWLFLGLFSLVIGFYAVVLFLDVEAFLLKLPWGEKIVKMAGVIRLGNKKRMMIAFGVSLVFQFIWSLPVWFYSMIFGAGLSLLSVYVFVPVINLILILPISVGGWGAREQLFLYFFSGIGTSNERILLASAFGGVLGVATSLLGGLMLLF